MADGMDGGAARFARLEGLAEALRLRRADRALVEDRRSDIDAATPEDVAALVDGLAAAGLPMDELKPLVARLLNLFHDALAARELRPGTDAAFFRALSAENARILEALERGKAAALRLKDAGPAPSAARAAALRDLSAFLADLAPLEAHYRRKENVVFPVFEELFPRWRCVQVMWSVHDDARAALSELASLVVAASASSTDATMFGALGRLFFAVNANVFREERVLHPVLARSAPAELLAARVGELLDLGPGFLRPAEAAAFRLEAAAPDSGARLGAGGSPPGGGAAAAGPEGAAQATRRADLDEAADAVVVPLDAGGLPRLVLDLVLKALPVDCTFVDAEDRVRWFSNGPDRIFPRSPAIIGRDVRNCHPPSSVGRVLAILEDFRAGRKDREAFWIRTGGRFVHIEYAAIRDSSTGRYLGCLEASQDLTERRALEGERRLAGG